MCGTMGVNQSRHTREVVSHVVVSVVFYSLICLFGIGCGYRVPSA